MPAGMASTVASHEAGTPRRREQLAKTIARYGRLTCAASANSDYMVLVSRPVSR